MGGVPVSMETGILRNVFLFLWKQEAGREEKALEVTNEAVSGPAAAAAAAESPLCAAAAAAASSSDPH